MYVVRRIGTSGAHYFAMLFNQASNASVSVNAVYLYETVAITDHTWYFFVGTVYKVNSYQSQFCLLFYTQWTCSLYNEIYEDSGSRLLEIGGGFLGIIRKVKVFHYPKIQIEAEHNMRLWSNGGCLAFNKHSCLQCDIENKGNDTDFRYKCYPDCEINQWDYDCR